MRGLSPVTGHTCPLSEALSQVISKAYGSRKAVIFNKVKAASIFYDILSRATYTVKWSSTALGTSVWSVVQLHIN